MKKFDNIIFGICIVLIVCMMVLAKPLSNLDELWNFNIARAISEGLVPYRDISMVSTPLLGFILAIPLKIFGAELFYTRICAIIMALLVCWLIYKALDILEIRKEVSNLVVGVCLAVFVNSLGINYNILSLIFVLAIIILELKIVSKYKWNKWYVNLIIGIFAGLTICSKQSIGLIISIIVILSPLYSLKKKVELIPTAKNMLYRLIGVIVPFSILAIYLATNNAFGGFIDYSVKGITTFSNTIPYSSLLSNPAIGAFSAIIPVMLIFGLIAVVVLKVKKREDVKLYILTVYAIGMFTIILPIADIEHFCIAVIPSFLLVAYSVRALLLKQIKDKNLNFKYEFKIISVFSVMSILACVFLIEFENSDVLGELSKYDYQNHFKYVYVTPEINKKIKAVNEYIAVKDKNVYILDASAAVYMIPANRYNKDYDMFCLGNLGAGGEEAIIERIKSEDALYMIKSDDSALNWQNPSKVREYIKESMELVDSKEGFDVYQNKVVSEDVKEESVNQE